MSVFDRLRRSADTATARTSLLADALADPKVRAAIDADLQQRAARVHADARRATAPRTGRTERTPEPLRVVSERLDLPAELEP